MCSGDLRSSLQGHRVTDKRGWSGSSFHHVWTFITQTKGLVQMLFHSFTPRLEKRSLWYLCVNMTGNVNDLWLGYTRLSFRTIKMYDVAPNLAEAQIRWAASTFGWTGVFSLYCWKYILSLQDIPSIHEKNVFFLDFYKKKGTIFNWSVIHEWVSSRKGPKHAFHTIYTIYTLFIQNYLEPNWNKKKKKSICKNWKMTFIERQWSNMDLVLFIFEFAIGSNEIIDILQLSCSNCSWICLTLRRNLFLLINCLV